MKTASKPKGRPKIPGKSKYTVHLFDANVERLRARGKALSAFIDTAIERHLKGGA